MSAQPQASLLPGGRLHLHHGPIDLIIGVEGPDQHDCFCAATARFGTVLTGLTGELPQLRQPVTAATQFVDPVARRMAQAAKPFSEIFVTPMAAVAGAVADEVLAAMVDGRQQPTKAYVNNGGDIAFHLSGSTELKALGPAGEITLHKCKTARGLATSGWRGRSYSRGIADAVTVIAPTASAADVAATLIANAVNLPDHPAISRCRANELSPDSDLGDRLVTTAVGALQPADVHQALKRGVNFARPLLRKGLIAQAVLSLNGEVRTISPQSANSPEGALSHA